MPRINYRVEFEGRAANLTFSQSIDALEFQSIFYMEKFGSWSSVISAMSLGVDWPAWWSRYESQRSRYKELLDGNLPLAQLSLGKKSRQIEMWRRHEICMRSGFAKCEYVHYPDFFEIEEIVRPCVLDDVREGFPRNVFGQYIMACPPNDRLIDFDNSLILNEVWKEHQSFFIERGFLVPWSKIPAEVVAAASSNQNLRETIVAHGGKAESARAANEYLFIEIATREPRVTEALRILSIPKNQWCRMPPSGLSWSQLQSYRWLARGLAASLFDMYEGLTASGLSAPEPIAPPRRP